MDPLASARLVGLGQRRAACSHCSLAQLCLPPGFDRESLEALDPLIRRPRPLKRGDHLFDLGAPFQAIYVIRSGSIKSYSATEDGQEQVTAFHLPGEFIGLDAIDSERHLFAARALETTSVCEFPFARMEALAERLPVLNRHLRNILARELALHRELFLLLGKKSAEERLAGLLLNLAGRYSKRGLSTSDFFLSMSRNDIANFLGLAVETVSRWFTRFQEEGLLSVERKHVQILDPDRLRSLAHHSPSDRPVAGGPKGGGADGR